MNEIPRIKFAHELTSQMTAEVRKYTELQKLAFENEIKTVRNALLTGQVDGYIPMMNYAKNTVHAEDDGEYKSYKELLENVITEHITGCVTKIEDIVMCDKDYSYNITFTVEADGFGVSDIKFYLVIPNAENLNSESYDYTYLHLGQTYLGYYDGNSNVSHIATSYYNEVLKAEFNKFIGMCRNDCFLSKIADL